MSALSKVQDWPVEHAAAALLSDGRVQEVGDTSRVYELASVTKLLSTYAVLLAVEEGVFDLDSPCGPAGATVRHLLAHASGVGFKREDRVKPVAERRIYSSAGFEILAEAVTQETGIDFPEYLRLGLLEPLGMDATALWGSAGHEARSTVADLTAFAGELLAPTLLHPDTLRQAYAVQYPELRGIVPGYGMQRPCPWGLGFEIRGEKSPHWTAASMPAETVGHFGQSGTYLWVHQPTGRAMVALTDRAFGDWAKPLWAETNEAIWRELAD
ncbi:serine hydrolase domain-containing protein [Corynebacterium sp. A21]|uniref:serine hydrolase domain-containing protein n=1 Tax=Corynebacterium sp. A21 TaxID=3457318 RepID=UPI003FCFC376